MAHPDQAFIDRLGVEIAEHQLQTEIKRLVLELLTCRYHEQDRRLKGGSRLVSGDTIAITIKQNNYWWPNPAPLCFATAKMAPRY